MAGIFWNSWVISYALILWYQDVAPSTICYFFLCIAVYSLWSLAYFRATIPDLTRFAASSASFSHSSLRRFPAADMHRHPAFGESEGDGRAVRVDADRLQRHAVQEKPHAEREVLLARQAPHDTRRRPVAHRVRPVDGAHSWRQRQQVRPSSRPSRCLNLGSRAGWWETCSRVNGERSWFQQAKPNSLFFYLFFVN